MIIIHVLFQNLKPVTFFQQWRVAYLFIISLLVSNSLTANDILLPELGDRSSSIFSHQQEAHIGQSWLHSYYNHTKIERDYLFQQYLENITSRLAKYADLNNKNLHVLLVDNPNLNAFAVPGGIIGLHSGLLLHANSEHELASVIAHELAHLSQRHFARSVEAQKTNSIKALAGLLTGIALAATLGSDAGIAALSISQGLAIDAQLRYSRQNEQEADRLGMQIIVKAGMDPNGFAKMFTNILRLGNFVATRTPEYLLTHPLPESRVADTELRAQKFPKRYYPQSELFNLMKVHAQLKSANTPHDALRHFQKEYAVHPKKPHIQYGLAKSYLKTLHIKEAEKIAQSLLANNATNEVYRALNIEVSNAAKDYGKAKNIAETSLLLEPNNYVISMLYAETLKLNNEFKASLKQLQKLSKTRSRDPVIWYELAETYGLEGDIFNLHKARAEYFILNGFYNNAIQHLKSAKDMITDDVVERSIIDKRISDILLLQTNKKF